MPAMSKKYPDIPLSKYGGEYAPLYEYEVGNMLYSLWPATTFSSAHYTMDVVNLRHPKRWLFWKRYTPKIIAVFKVKLRPRKAQRPPAPIAPRSEEHTSELQSL